MTETMIFGAAIGWLTGELLLFRHRPKVRLAIALILALAALLLIPIPATV